MAEPGEDLPLSQSAFAARLKKLGAPQRFGVAVSGGRDSMALAILSAAYGRAAGADVCAFTVDHGLRAEAADEAAKAKAWCEALGLIHETLVWRGEKPKTGLQAGARAARYRLLANAANRAGCSALLTAHTMDDQAETVLMRLARGAGLRGLAGMRDEVAIAAGPGPAVRLMRPLLDTARAAVTVFVDEAGQDYIDDPSNEDEKFERVRVRALLATLGSDVLNVRSLSEAARNFQAADEVMRAEELFLFDRLAGCFHHWGGVSLGRWDAEAPAAESLAGRLIFAVSGGEARPKDAAAAAAFAQAVSAGAATLGGALIKRWRGALWIVREAAALTGRAGVEPAAAVPLEGRLLWDNRFIIEGEAEGLEIAPMGAAAAAFLGDRAVLFQGPPEALGALPGQYGAGLLTGAPALPFTGGEGACAKALTKERFDGRTIRFS